MQEKKRKKKNPAAEQEEQTKKMQSVAETASEQPTAEEPPKESAQKSSKSKQKPTASGSANTKENRRTGWILAEVAISAALGWRTTPSKFRSPQPHRILQTQQEQRIPTKTAIRATCIRAFPWTIRKFTTGI